MGLKGVGLFSLGGFVSSCTTGVNGGGWIAKPKNRSAVCMAVSATFAIMGAYVASSAASNLEKWNIYIHEREN